jgi:sulfite reductase (ferredoxin)
MQSFRTELENPVVEKDILDLEKKIRLYREGKLDPEKFRSLRLARGVYGQRQQGVQMVRIKIPFGKLSIRQLLVIADIADEYSNGNLHLTTRQDIQIHYVSLERTPELWSKLEADDITLREACGNTVRNITASAFAGIDPHEPFDVSPYAKTLFKFFLRNPVQENLGRKFKIAFSSSEEDTAYTFIHDLGFIPKIKQENGVIIRGFKVLLGGGLGAQPFLAQTAFEFLPEEKIIPFAEAVVRVFDRYGERTNRHKARLKYLVSKIGLTAFLKLVEEEYPALKSLHEKFSFEPEVADLSHLENTKQHFYPEEITDSMKYKQWRNTNVFEQKQKGFYAVGVNIPLGNIRTDKARAFAEIVKKYAADDIRITLSQNFLIRFVPERLLPGLFRELDILGLTLPGFGSVADITACPGTDTCNLGISNSTNVARALERVVREEFPDLIYEKDLRIKISGCMNSCGQHGLAHIGFHGSSINTDKGVVPALQVLLGGGPAGDGKGRIADKLLKIPSKRGPAVLRTLLQDFEDHAEEHQTFHEYYDAKGRTYFKNLLKAYTDLSTLQEDEFRDWGYDEPFTTSIGTGECAGVLIDLVATLFFEAEEKLESAITTLQEKRYADSIYHSYSVFIHAAKGLLLTHNVHTSTHHQLINEFEKHFAETGIFHSPSGFKNLVLQIQKNPPEKKFAEVYLSQAESFLRWAQQHREEQIKKEQTTEKEQSNIVSHETIQDNLSL